MECQPYIHIRWSYHTQCREATTTGDSSDINSGDARCPRHLCSPHRWDLTSGQSHPSNGIRQQYKEIIKGFTMQALTTDTRVRWNCTLSDHTTLAHLDKASSRLSGSVAGWPSIRLVPPGDNSSFDECVGGKDTRIISPAYVYRARRAARRAFGSF